MEKDKLRSRLAALLQKQKERKRWLKAVSALGCVIVFCTVYALVLPAITLEKEPRILKCPLEIHTHSEVCYDGEQNLICGKADYVLHTHQEDCYDSEGSLVCTLPEKEAHTHTDECWEEQAVLICGQEEGAGAHVHTEDCYQSAEGEQTLVCGQEESAGHVHGEDCYETVTEEKKNLICGQEEGAGAHTHSESCYKTEKVLVCEKEEIIAHTHDESCRDEAGNLICGLLEVQEHVHGDGCFASAEDRLLAAEPFPDAAELSVGEVQTIAIDTPGKRTVVRVNYECAHNYAFNAAPDQEIKITYYDAEGNRIGERSGKDWLSVKNRAEAGETEYWEIAMKDENATGEIPVYVDYEAHTFQGGICGKCGKKLSELRGFCGEKKNLENVRWSVTDQGELQIAGTGRMNGNSGFWENTGIPVTSLSVGKEITNVGGFEGMERLKSVKLPDSVTVIESGAFDSCTGLHTINIPEGVTEIGSRAFFSCTGLEAIVLPEGLRTLGMHAFDGCSGLDVITLPTSVTEIGFRVFSGKVKVIWEAVKCTVDRDNTFGGLEFSEKVDYLDKDIVEVLGRTDFTFRGPNRITFDDGGAVGKTELRKGEYYADEKGALYLVNEKTQTAELAYCPGGLTVYEIPKEVGMTGDTLFPVKSVGSYAFANADDLEALTFGDGIGLSEVKNFAFAECRTLKSVGEVTTVSGAVSLLEEMGIQVGAMPFYKTGLTSESVEAEALKEKGSSVKVGTEGGQSLSVYDGGTEHTLLTGEKVTLNLSINNPSAGTKRFRVYIQFSETKGQFLLELGTHSYKTDQNNYVDVHTVETLVPDVYCVEIDPLKEGDTLNFNVPIAYPSPNSPGGQAYVWGVSLSQEECEELDQYGDYGVTAKDVASYLWFEWGTKRDEFSLTKTGNRGAAIMGDGTEGGPVTVRNLGYRIEHENTFSSVSYGENHMQTSCFTDILYLPEHFSWNEEILGKIQKKDYIIKGEVSGDRNYGESINVFLEDGTKYRVLELSSKNDYGIAVKNCEVVESEGKTGLKLEWNIDGEASGFDLLIGERTIEADAEALAEQLRTEEKLKISFPNTVEVTEEFQYGEPNISQASGTVVLKVGQPDFTFLADIAQREIYCGEEADGALILKNEKALPYKGVQSVETRGIDKYLYVKAENLEQMFRDGTMFGGRTLGERLKTITISNAGLCTPVLKKDAVNTEGEGGKRVNQQYKGTNTTYETPDIPSTKPDVCTKTALADLTLQWKEGETGSTILLTVREQQPSSESERTYEIGEGKAYTGIAQALEALGYLVVSNTTFSMEWDVADTTLYSGQEVRFRIPLTAKNTFMLLDNDKLEEYVVRDTVNSFAYLRGNADYLAGGHTGNTHAADNCGVEKDFELRLSANVYRENTEQEEDSSVRVGDLIEYRGELENKGTSAKYEALPVTAFVGSGQLVLVPADENLNLKNISLEEISLSGKTYYKLNKPGVYENVYLGGKTADEIEVKENRDTLIRWHLSDVSSTDFTWGAIVEPEDTGATFSLDNCLWLSDHQSHRLFDPCGLTGTRVEVDKWIVTEKGDTPTSDKKVDHSVLKEGESVTYRMDVQNLGQSSMTLEGEYLWDILPFGSSGTYWEKDVTVTNVSYGSIGGDYRITGGTKDSWNIQAENSDIGDTPAGQQYLCWDSDFKVSFTGTLCIYVTLTYPSDTTTETAWTDYVESYGDQSIINTFSAYKYWADVVHDVPSKGQVYLQKGVLGTGIRHSRYGYEIIWRGNTGSRQYYDNRYNDKSEQVDGVVTYYVSLYNGGNTKLYLNDVQDVLPRGFTFLNFVDEEEGTENISKKVRGKYHEAVLTAGGQQLLEEQYKDFCIDAKTETNAEGRQVVSFSFDNKDFGNLHYDGARNKYYLRKGEAIVFAYNCLTNDRAETDDRALNRVAMPYYNYNYGGTETAENVSSIGWLNEGAPGYNEGECYILDTKTAESMGFLKGQDDTAQWLTSDVTVARGGIIPGISKKALKATSGEGVVVQTPELVDAQDVITWKVSARNTGNYSIRDYVLTDVMEKPYRFTGKVGYRVDYSTEKNISIAGTLFEIRNTWEKAGDIVRILANGKGYDVKVNAAEPVEILVKLKDGSEWYSGTLQVWVGIDEAGNQSLSVRFPDGEIPIPSGGSGEMTLDTLYPDTAARVNDVFLNTSYITPVQDFDRGQVVQGRYTEYTLPGEAEPRPSVMNASQIILTYGYATSSLKAVEELKADENGGLSLTGNAINSRTDPYYITMSEQDQKQVRYTLTVNNGVETTNLDLNQLTVIDSLPRTGDHSVFDEEDLRYSEFAVHLEDDPDFKVVVKKSDNTSVTLTPDQYRLEYSVERDFKEEDWKGEEKDNDQWSKMPAKNAQSFRLVIGKDADGNALVPAGATVEISFNARLSDEAKEGQLAWNSFGYSYIVPQGEASITLKAAPLKVGVKVPFVPRLVKELKTESGMPFQAEKAMEFGFLIYEGTAVEGLDSLSTEDEIKVKLYEAGRTYGKVTLTVPKGASASEEKVLDAKALPGWKWVNGASYTLLELPFTEEGYEFGYIGELQSPNNYTFRYQGATLQRLAAVNVRDTWEILIFKRDGATHTSLTGAVFGLYAGDSTKQLTEEGYAAKLKELGLDPSGMPSYEKISSMQTAQGDSTAEDWYLTEIGVSDTDGELSFGALSGAAYYVRELKAPGGYSLSKEQGKVVRREDCAGGQNIYYWTVYNESAYELPKTGGTGTEAVRTLGVLMTASALSLAYVGKRRNAKRRNKEER